MIFVQFVYIIDIFLIKIEIDNISVIRAIMYLYRCLLFTIYILYIYYLCIIYRMYVKVHVQMQYIILLYINHLTINTF